MKIAFFCSCLEAGKDGVGDYMRQLAAECAKQSGGESLLVALNDSCLRTDETERREEQAGMKVFRLSPALSWKERAARLEPELKKFSPDALSFHYVPFGYHPRGLAAEWPHALGKVFKGIPLHWMLHETWVGGYYGAPLKQRLLGSLQRWGIRRVIKNWKPKAVHSTNPAYVAMLEEAGIFSKRLKMFGAVPQAEPHADAAAWFRGLISEEGFAFHADEREDLWFGLFFGTLHTNWPHEPLFGLLASAARQQNKKVILLSLGYLRTGESLWNRMEKTYKNEFKFIRLGEKSTGDIARIFGEVDFGVTSNPANIIGKSSATAAMLDHGLPVLTNWEGAPLRLKKIHDFSTVPEPLIWSADDTLAAKLKGMNRKIRCFDSELPRAARQVLQDLGFS